MHALVRQRGSHQGQIAAGDLHGALLEIGLQNFIRVLVNDAEIPQQPADGAIAVAGLALALIDGVVDL